MDLIKAHIKKLQSFKRRIPKTIEKAIRDNEEFILALNTEDQLYDDGVDNRGDKIKPAYAPSTVAYKKRNNQPTGRVTLRDTEVFHRSFYIYYGPDNFEIKTSDPLEPILTHKYGEAIKGLTDENLQYVTERFVAPALNKLLKTL